MSNIILEILAKAGVKPTDQFWVKVTNKSWMPLSIENIGTGPRGLPAISVCHYGEQNGDLMRDPEMCFELVDDARASLVKQ